MSKFSKTVRAFKHEDSTAWEVVESLSDEMEFSNDGFAHGELDELVHELQASGVERSYPTLNRYGHASRVWHLSTTSQRQVIRSSASPAAVGILSRGGFSPEAISSKLSRGTISRTQAEAMVADLKSDGEPKPPKEKDWEAELLKSGRALLRALNNLRGHEFDDPMAELMFGLWQPRTLEVDWDAEFAALSEEGSA